MHVSDPPAGIVVKAATGFDGSMFHLVVRAESDIDPALLADVASRVGGALAATLIGWPAPQAEEAAPRPPPVSTPPPAGELRIVRISDGRYGVHVERDGDYYSNYAYVDEHRLMNKVLPAALDDLREISPVDSTDEGCAD